MKTFKSILLLLLISSQLYAPEISNESVYILKDEAIQPFEKLWKAICIVESSNNPSAINEKEQAYGIAQIRQCRIDHFNKLTGKNYDLQDCLNSRIAKEIFMRFATKLDLEMTARNWNGRGKMTLIYWEKVKKYL
jgi:hypothetical protein